MISQFNGFKPLIRFFAGSTEPAWNSLSPVYLCPFRYPCCLYLKINKLKKKKKEASQWCVKISLGDSPLDNGRWGTHKEAEMEKGLERELRWSVIMREVDGVQELTLESSRKKG